MSNDKKRFKTIIFDFDGTIADTFDLIFQIANENVEKLGIRKLTDDDKELVRNSSYRELIDEFEIALLKIPIIVRFMQKQMKKDLANIPIFNEMDNVMRKLNKEGYRLGIVTNNTKHNVNEFLKNNEISELFDFVYSSKDYFGKDRKLKKVIKKHDLDKDKTLYVGDEVRDVVGAKKAGLKVAAVSWGFNGPKSLEENDPDVVIKQPWELYNYIKK